MAVEYDSLLLETGDHLLLEDSGKIIIGEYEGPDDVASGAGSGRPWPDRMLNILRPHRVMIDDEDVLLI